MIPASYEPLIAPARPRRQLWRTLLGLAIIAVVYFLGMIGLVMVLGQARGGVPIGVILAEIRDAASPWAVIWTLAGFAGVWPGVWIALRLLHRRPLRSLIGRAPVVLRDFVTGVVILIVVGGGLTLALVPILPPLVWGGVGTGWLGFLPLALIGLAVQTGAEELVFRGYLQSQLAARFGSRALALLAPAALFGLAHFDPGGGTSRAAITAASAGLFGLAAGDLTMRTGALGLAWGMHFANNVLAILILSLMGGLDGLALLRAPVVPEALVSPLLISDMLVTLAVWAACRIWLRRR